MLGNDTVCAESFTLVKTSVICDKELFFQPSFSVRTTEVETKPHPAVRTQLQNHSHEITAVITNYPAVV